MIVILTKTFAILLALIVISKSYTDLRLRRESLLMFLFWTTTWLGIVLVALAPSIVDRVIAIGGGQAGIGTVFGIAFMFMFFVVYRIYVKLDRTEQKMVRLVQELAMEKAKIEMPSLKRPSSSDNA